MTVADAERRAAEHAFWWHSIDLGDGVVSPGHKPATVLQEELDSLKLPDLQGKTVLDIGAWDGYFSFAAERLGARRVVAMDFYTWATHPAAIADRTGDSSWSVPEHTWDPVGLPGRRGFDLAREALDSEVETLFVDLLTLDPEQIGQFDVVLFLGVLYHTRFPQEMLDKVAALTRETMIMETESFSLRGYEDLSLGEFFETDELKGDDSNWWSFTEPALAGMCRSSGFAQVEFVEPYHRDETDALGRTRHRALVHAHK